MALIDFTNLTNANSTIEIIQYINSDLTGGLFSLFLLIGYFIILFVTFDAGSGPETFLLVSFLLAIVGGYFFLAGIVTLYVAITLLIMVFLAVIIVLFIR